MPDVSHGQEASAPHHRDTSTGPRGPRALVAGSSPREGEPRDGEAGAMASPSGLRHTVLPAMPPLTPVRPVRAEKGDQPCPKSGCR